MMSDELLPSERLLIGLGAAVGAGCLPCSEHYLEKARKAGVRSEEVGEAVAVAAAVRRRATAEMVWRVAQKMGEEVPAPEELTPEFSRWLETLVGFGAAYAANSPPLVRRSIGALREKGVSDEQMTAAAEAARKPKHMAARICEREVAAALGTAGLGRDGEASCCAQPCAADVEPEATE